MQTEEERDDFIEHFVNTSLVVPNATFRMPEFLGNQVEAIPFCSFGSTIELSFEDGKEDYQCDLFNPILIGKGVGYAFNSLAMSEIFRPTTNVQVSWLLYQ
jgi:hypothetical protein